MEVTVLRPQRSGRPSTEGSEALDRHILSTATRLFSEQGYAATSVDQIAVIGGVGKQTIYRRYSSKEDLFRAVLGDMTQGLVASAARAETDQGDPLFALRTVCEALLALCSKPESIAIYRILIAESQRFPGLVDHVVSTVSDPFNNTVVRLLRSARRAGQIRRDCDPETTNRALHGLITGWAVQQMLLGRKGHANEAERAAFFKAAWDLFLKGVGVQGATPRPRRRIK